MDKNGVEKRKKEESIGLRALKKEIEKIRKEMNTDSEELRHETKQLYDNGLYS